MRPLHHKLLRDLTAHRGQYLAIALVIAVGVAAQVSTGGLLASLGAARDDFYAAGRFADAFASAVRAPDSLASQIARLPGVRQASTRVVTLAVAVDSRLDEPASLELVSWSDTLDAVVLAAGRAPRADGAEIVLASAFAAAHGLVPGDTLAVVVHGRRVDLEVVGVGDSPEYVYQIAPGEMLPDYRRHTVAWMAHARLAALAGLEGAFNDVAVALAPGADPAPTLAALDTLLGPWGGGGAYARNEQLSHRFIQNELEELDVHATVVPLVFLAAAAFLLHLVITRRVTRERELIGMLKAFGYEDATIVAHYLELGLAIFAVGALLGIALGLWLGRLLAGLYVDFFRFPDLGFHLDPARTAIGLVVSCAAVASGTIAGLVAVARLPPAEAMRPPSPPAYRAGRGPARMLSRLLGLPERLIVRHLVRTPLRTSLTVAGLAAACALVAFSGFQHDAIDLMTEFHFERQDSSDLTVTFLDPVAGRAAQELLRRPGVRAAEPFRTVPVRLHHGHATYRTVLEGREADARLTRLLDRDGRELRLPADGVVLSAQLGRMLDLAPDDVVEVELLVGRRSRHRVVVARLLDDYVGVGAWMRLDALHRLLAEQDAVDGLRLTVAPEYRAALPVELALLPSVASVGRREARLDAFQESFGQSLLIVAFVFLMIAGTLAFGMVFNAARTLLDERRRELATLRVLGLGRAETSYLLLAELVLLALLALPPGLGLGWALAALLARAMQSELFRVPVVLAPASYARAVVVLLAATGASAAWSVLDLWRLDMRESLGARD